MDRLTPPPLLGRIHARHWRALDCVIAIGYGFAAAMLLGKHSNSALGLAAALAGGAALALPIARRRRRPLAAFLLALAASGVLALVQPRSVMAGLVVLGFVLYTLAAGARPAASVLALVTALAAAWATALPDFRHLGGAVAFSFAYLAVWNVGNAGSLHRRYTGDLLSGHVAEERLRIARELHDVLAHQMSVITVQAGYAGLLLDGGADPGPPQRARAALAVIESTGRETLEEMRRLVSVLRSDAAAAAAADAHEGDGAGELTPAPGLADLPRLVEQAARAGIRVEVAVSGQGRTLRPGEDLAAYRIAQEAITNVIKHSGGTTALVRLDYGRDELVIEICDDGVGAVRPGPPEAGRGLTGMRERVRLYGGRLQVGPTPLGGFKVTALLPLAASAKSGAR